MQFWFLGQKDQWLCTDGWNFLFTILGSPKNIVILLFCLILSLHILQSIYVMDYSLLVGIDETHKELVIGIIDFMRQYTWDKQLETWVKASGILGGSKHATPTVISPLQYKKRFRKAMSNYFLTVPDHWSSWVLFPAARYSRHCFNSNYRWIYHYELFYKDQSSYLLTLYFIDLFNLALLVSCFLNSIYGDEFSEHQALPFALLSRVCIHQVAQSSQLL